jgi:D-glycero-alpha-D-manno-heptose-7-phosphate kinase
MEKRNTTVRGKAPLRISLSGGGTDLDYIFNEYGGAVVNCSIDKYVHMSLTKRRDKKIFVNGKILNKDEVLVNKILELIKPKFGFDLYYYNDILPGSGLGNSSAFVVLFLNLVSDLYNKRIDDFDTINLAYEIETSLKEGGWQDQYATTFGSFNFIEFDKDTKRIYPLRLRYRFLQDLNDHLLLIYIGGKKDKDTHKQLREYSEKNIDELVRTRRIKSLAFRMRDCLLNQKIDDIGKLLDENWQLKRNKFTSNRKIDKLYSLALSNGAEGGKLCGSGQAGHFLFFVRPENRNQLVNALRKYKVVDFNFSIHGVETWK